MSSLKTSFVDDVLVAQFEHADLRNMQHVRQSGAELLDACVAAKGKMLLDFSEVRQMTSEMVGQLLMLASRCKGKSITLLGCAANEGILLILDTVRFTTLVPIYADQSTALLAFAATTENLGASQEFSVHPDVLAKQAAEGDVDAGFDLAVCYEQGAGVEQDMDEAIKRFRRAADAGHVEAQHKLGIAYAYGMHVDQDYDQAIAWYQRAAEQGQSDAQYALGMTYLYGIGVEPDAEVAAGWYEKAAAQGHNRASEELSRLGATS